jgi:uncharacterized protein YjiS (DUF1127 family)
MLRFFIRPIDGLWPFAQLSPRSGHALVWRSLLSALKSSVAALAEQVRFRRAERQLQALEHRLLQDIGIGRSEIGSVVRHGRRR